MEIMSDSNGCGSLNRKVYNFTTQDAGRTSGTAYGTLPLATDGTGSQVSINGSTDLIKVIVGNNGACVQSIVYQSFDGIARNAELYVYGQGPEGIGSGTLHLTFRTPSDNDHTVGLTSSSPDCHNDKFQETEAITKIEWKSD